MRLVLQSLLILAVVLAQPAFAQTPGCRPELSGQRGADLTVLPLQLGPNSVLAPAGEPTTELEARSGEAFRVLVRPLEGSSRPSEPGCPVRVNVGRLTSVARILTREGFLFDRGNAYAQLRPGEERALDFEIKPFQEWNSAAERVELESVTIRLPETAEFVARLPEPITPPAGTVCADVVYADARPAAGVVLGLSIPPGGPTDRRPVGPDGRVCWDGFDESHYGDIGLEDEVEPALGLPNRRYVSLDTSYRLFIVKRPR